MEALIGPFVIGIDDAERHRSAREALDHADRRHEPETHRDDVRRVAEQAGELAEALLDDAGGTLDAAQGLCDPVVHAGIADYVGIEAPDAATLLRWCRAIGRDIFLNPLESSGVAAEAARGRNRTTRAVRRRPLRAPPDHPQGPRKVPATFGHESARGFTHGGPGNGIPSA